MKKNLFKILILILMFLPLIFARHYLSIFYFQNDINRMAINIETKKDIGKIFICFDENCDNLKYEKGIYSYKLNQENSLFYNDFENIELILNNEKDMVNVTTVSVFNGNKLNYYKNSDLFGKISYFNDSQKFIVSIPFDSNSKAILQKIAVYFQSIFYNWYFYVFAYILIAVYFIKYDVKLNFKVKNLIIPILFLGLFLRLSHISFVPFWNDELYTLTVISDLGSGLNLKNTFLDPGNPPLFFILSNIWLIFFNKSVFLIRLLPLILGTLLIYNVYILAKKVLNKKIALIASFLTSINIFLIVESNEIRSYILAMNLLLLTSYYFKKLINDFSSKNLTLFSLLSILLVNTHYYCFLCVIFNFIFGLFVFKKERLFKFISVNILAFLSFVPYLIISFKNSINEKFNTWLPMPSVDVVYDHIIFYFGDVLCFGLVLSFLMFMINKVNKQEKNVIKYFVLMIAFVFVTAFLISITVKPILFERYFCIFIPFLIIITSIYLNFDFKTKFNPVIIGLIFLFSINMPKYENFNLFSNIYFMVKYSTIDSLSYGENSDSYFIIPDNIKYVKYFSEDFKNIKKENIVVSQYGITEDVDIIDYIIKNSNKNKVVIYLPEICVNMLVLSKYKPIKLNTSILPIYKIVCDKI